MAAEYFRLVSLYQSQDGYVLAAFGFAALATLGYGFLARLNKRPLLYLYIVSLLFVYLAASILFIGAQL